MNLKLFNVAGVDAPTIICSNNNKIHEINDGNDGILLIATIPANNNHNPLTLPDKSDSEDTLDNKDQNKDKENNHDNLSNNNSLQGDGQEADKPDEGWAENQDQGVRRSKHNNKGTTAKYTDYGLLMNLRQAKGGHR